MSESERISQRSPEHIFQASPAPSPVQHNGSAASNTHRDLNQIIAHAREDIRHLREERSRHEAQIAEIARERDEIQQHYAHLYENFVEAVHMAAEEEVRRAAQQLQTTPDHIPALFEPIQESIIGWTAKQQAEREAELRQKVATVEQQAALIRQELIEEREALKAEREKFSQERQTFTAYMKARETGLHHRWVVKAWGTAGVMFLVLPALQFYLLLQNASVLNIIIIPTTICLTLTALINLVRARRRADKPAPKPK
jgi:chromosome segregation ATPase